MLGISRSVIFSHPERKLSDQEVESFIYKVNLRCTGFPVAYIVGTKEFYGRDFFVNPSVLIPKPDTEILVHRGIEIISKNLQSTSRLKLVDLCTGSGCVGISIWKELEASFDVNKTWFFATDISCDALEVAKKNCSFHNCNIEYLLCDLFQSEELVNLDGIISNPPYVPAKIANQLLEDGRSEPLLALDGDCNGSEDGTGLIARLLPQGFAALNPGGFILLETGEYNAEKTAELMKNTGFIDIQIHSDLSGMLRVVEGWKAREL